MREKIKGEENPGGVFKNVKLNKVNGLKSGSPPAQETEPVGRGIGRPRGPQTAPPPRDPASCPASFSQTHPHHTIQNKPTADMDPDSEPEQGGAGRKSTHLFSLRWIIVTSPGAHTPPSPPISSQ